MIRTEKMTPHQMQEWLQNGTLSYSQSLCSLANWPRQRQCQLIESIMLGIPLAPIFVSENWQGHYILIDGLNRVKSILVFIDGGYQLNNLSILKDYNKSFFYDLPYYMQNKLAYCKLDICVIPVNTDQSVVASVLKRVNFPNTSIHKEQVIDVLNTFQKK